MGCVFCISTFSFAQSAEDSVKQVVTGLFKAAYEADSAAVITFFWPDAAVHTVLPGRLRLEKPEQLASAFGRLRKGQLDEQIRFGSIHIDAYLASVWIPYRLYFDGKFIHCGVDAIQLVRINGLWKIAHLIDTRRKDCD